MLAGATSATTPLRRPGPTNRAGADPSAPRSVPGRRARCWTSPATKELSSGASRPSSAASSRRSPFRSEMETTPPSARSPSTPGAPGPSPRRGAAARHSPSTGVQIHLEARADSRRRRSSAGAYVDLLENMERIDQVIRQQGDAEEMLHGVLETVQAIFDCDRTWLLYPCDPGAPSFRVPVEVAKPEYVGPGGTHVDVPMEAGVADTLEAVLAADGPLPFANGTERPVDPLAAKRFGVQSQLLMAVHPRVGMPWVFGVHQCSHPRRWTSRELTEFREIGRRIADGLSNALILSDLHVSEARLATAVSEWRTTFDDERLRRPARLSASLRALQRGDQRVHRCRNRRPCRARLLRALPLRRGRLRRLPRAASPQQHEGGVKHHS